MNIALTQSRFSFIGERAISIRPVCVAGRAPPPRKVMCNTLEKPQVSSFVPNLMPLNLMPLISPYWSVYSHPDHKNDLLYPTKFCHLVLRSVPFVYFGENLLLSAFLLHAFTTRRESIITNKSKKTNKSTSNVAPSPRHPTPCMRFIRATQIQKIQSSGRCFVVFSSSERNPRFKKQLHI
jgi:hypothetical protein